MQEIVLIGNFLILCGKEGGEVYQLLNNLIATSLDSAFAVPSKLFCISVKQG